MVPTMEMMIAVMMLVMQGKENTKKVMLDILMIWI